VAQFTTDFTADCVEYCPLSGHQDLFVCATYQLDEDTQERKGRIYLGSHPSNPLADASNSSSSSLSASSGIHIEQTLDMSGVFDVKWNDFGWIACALADSSTVVHKLHTTSPATSPATSSTSRRRAQLSEHAIYTLRSELAAESCALSVDWTTRPSSAPRLSRTERCSSFSSSSSSSVPESSKSCCGSSSESCEGSSTMHAPLESESHSCSADQLAVSYANGSLAVFDLGAAERTASLSEWTAHDFETWIVAYDYWTPAVVYSGSDDTFFRGWDLRCGPGRTFSKRHDMGITTIHCHPHNSHLLAVGSYDEQVRIWDKRNMREAVATVGTGGGVWRLKWHPQDPSLLLSASMRGGFHVLRFDGVSSDADEAKENTHLQGDNPDELLRILHSYGSPHDVQKLAYGVDWCAASGSHLIGCCSFYDRLFSLWQYV